MGKKKVKSEYSVNIKLLDVSKNERFTIRLGKFGLYFYDNKRNVAINLQTAKNLLNIWSERNEKN